MKLLFTAAHCAISNGCPDLSGNACKRPLPVWQKISLDTQGVVDMVGEWAGYQRIRIGDLRVIFWYNDGDDTIYVDHVGPRGDIYKQ